MTSARRRVSSRDAASLAGHRCRAAALIVGLVLLVFGTGGCMRPATVEVTPRANVRGPRVLSVVAHPDDETTFAVTLYKITTELDGAVDVLVVTNGEGGYKYALPAERVYGAALTDEATGRRLLPRIRREEMLAGCRLLGVQRVTFLGERDHRYTQDPMEVLDPAAGVWDLDHVRTVIARALADDRYDVVLTLLPLPGTHGHHQAVTRLVLEAARALPPDRRPLLLGAVVHDRGEHPVGAGERAALAGVADGLVAIGGGPGHRVDRTATFGYRDRLDYRVLVRWVIAEHKSQGMLQMTACDGEIEHFWPYRTNAADAEARARRLFDALAQARPRSPKTR